MLLFPAPYPGSYNFTDVLIVAGDSQGRGQASGTLLNYAPSSAVQLWDSAAFVQYVPGTTAGLQAATFAMTGNWAGEAEFARRHQLKHPNRKLRIIHFGTDGTLLGGHWLPGQQMFNSGTNLVNAALAAIVAAGEVPNIIGTVVYLGSNDANDATATSNFQANMASFVAGIHSTWNVPADKPILWQRTPNNPNLWAGCAAIRAAQVAAAVANPIIHLFNTDDVPLDLGDNTHFARFGQRIIGSRVADFFIGSGYALTEAAPSIVNGAFTNDIDYVDFSGAAPTWAAGKLIQTGASGDLIIAYAVGLTVGATYTLSTVFSPVSNDFYIYVQSGGTQIGGDYIGAASPSAITFTATSPCERIVLNRIAAGTMNIDSLSIA